jgi:hypothetical protein
LGADRRELQLGGNVNKQAVADYINKNAAALHGIEPHRLDIGGDITANDVQSMKVYGDVVKVAVDRGTKGTPTYSIPLAALSDPEEPPVEEPADIDPADLSVRDIRELELDEAGWHQLLEAERAKKNRSSAIDYIEAQLLQPPGQPR